MRSFALPSGEERDSPVNCLGGAVGEVHRLSPCVNLSFAEPHPARKLATFPRGEGTSSGSQARHLPQRGRHLIRLASSPVTVHWTVTPPEGGEGRSSLFLIAGAIRSRGEFFLLLEQCGFNHFVNTQTNRFKRFIDLPIRIAHNVNPYCL